MSEGYVDAVGNVVCPAAMLAERKDHQDKAQAGLMLFQGRVYAPGEALHDGGVARVERPVADGV